MLRVALPLAGFTAMLFVAAGPALAAANLVQNGGFESTPGLTASGQITGSNVANWTTAGYNFIFFPGAGTSGTTADTIGAPQQYGQVYLWGPGDGSNNGLTLSANGGNFLAADADTAINTSANFPGTIAQTIGGLTVGTNYLLTFLWAGAEQEQGTKYHAANNEAWSVSFGSQAYTTPTDNNTSEGFVPWKQASVLFTATSVSQTLAFLAVGGPSGTPPFALLDGVSLVAAPEPSTWALMAGGLGLLGIAGLRRRRASFSSASAGSAAAAD